MAAQWLISDRSLLCFTQVVYAAGQLKPLDLKPKTVIVDIKLGEVTVKMPCKGNQGPIFGSPNSISHMRNRRGKFLEH